MSNKALIGGDNLYNSQPIDTNEELQIQNTDTSTGKIIDDIVNDIFHSAVEKSVSAALNHLLELKENVLNEICATFPDLEINKDEYLCLTKTYDNEFESILENIKWRKRSIYNVDLEEEIKKIIEEIKNLKTTVMTNVIKQDGDGDVLNDDLKEERETNSSCAVCYKYAATNLHSHGETSLEPIIVNNFAEETVLQVVNLEIDDSSNTSSSTSSLPNNTIRMEELDEIILNSPNDDSSLGHGDLPHFLNVNVNEEIHVALDTCAGENVVQHPVPNPEPESNLESEDVLNPPDKEKVAKKKKKNFGLRFWDIFRKGSKQSPEASPILK